MTVLIGRMQPSGHGTEPAHAFERDPGGARMWPSSACLVAALAGASAAWLSAGSLGLLGEALRHVLTWLLLGMAVVLCRPQDEHRIWRWLRVLLAATAIGAIASSSLMPAGALASAVVLAVLAGGRSDPDRQVLLATASGCAVFGLYRIAVTSSSWFWLMTDAVGGALGHIGSMLTGRTLAIGAAFAGIDFLVLTLAVCAACLVLTGPARRRLAAAGLGAIVLAEAAWLAILAQALRLAEIVGPPAVPEESFWRGALAAAVPWNLPALALVVFLPVLAWILRSVPAPVPAAAADAQTATAGRRKTSPGGHTAAGGWKMSSLSVLAAVILAAALPMLTTLSPGLGPLEGRKIVASDNVYGNWHRPEHGQYGRLSIGMYGMLDQYIESLGGQFLVSEHLSEEDLSNASALLLIYPHKPWEQGQVERILNFAGSGGTVVVFGEHTILDDGGQRFNDILRHTNMRIRFDTAEWAVGGWMQSLDAMGHPAFTGISQDRYGVVIGASVEARWPARPLLTARWGFRDRGDPANGLSKLGDQKLQPDEPVGDVILAAEEPFGQGRMIAFGDPGSIINGITPGSHVFTSRLLSYIANRSAGSPQAAPRQIAAMVVLAAAATILVVFVRGWTVGLASAAAALSLLACTALTYRGNEVLPDGRVFAPINRLAYIDDSHIGAFSGEAIREDLREGGLQGLALTLMRSGYLVLMMPEFSSQRIERAGLMISIAPSKAFSEDERRVVRKFVEDGGIYILMAGWEEAGPSRDLLADFDFAIDETLFGMGQVVDGQPRYMRYFKSPYTPAADGQFAHVRFQTAWPLSYSGPKEGYRVFAYGPTIKGNLPIIAARYVGKGKFVVIGDTCFAMNRNLERMDGQPIEDKRENAEFWRWFLGELTGVDPYVPTNTATIPPSAATMVEPTASEPPGAQEVPPPASPAGDAAGQADDQEAAS